MTAGNEDDPCLSVLPAEENKQPPASSSWGILMDKVSLNLPPIFGSLTDNGEEEDYDDSDRLLEEGEEDKDNVILPPRK